uniref:hypothetical protein n=1 Tax=Pseudomonas aeruginosa TaxID=287 RepID=UPI00397DBAD6
VFLYIHFLSKALLSIYIFLNPLNSTALSCGFLIFAQSLTSKEFELFAPVIWLISNNTTRAIF